jgi:carbon-monoxide dehydrogenase medium subunit
MFEINKWNTHIIRKPFQYHQPESIHDATSLLEKLPNCKVIAGGTDLIPQMKQRIIEPKHLINLKKIQEILGINQTSNGVWIGAATKLRTIEKSQLVKDKIPLLYLATKTIGSIQIRNMGTLGGNVCNASPAADGALGLVALDAITHIYGANGKRNVPINTIFTGPSSTILENNEIITGFTVPIPEKNTGCHFISIGRMALDISTISIAATITKENSKATKVRIALGSVAPTPIRLIDVEEYLIGKKLTDILMKEAAKMVSKRINPITDIRATSDYRREAAKGMTMETLKKAWTLGVENEN